MGTHGTRPRGRPQGHSDAFSYAPIASHRTEAFRAQRFAGELADPRADDGGGRRLLNTSYCGSWSMVCPSALAPAPRTGQCAVYDPASDRLVIAYGLSCEGEPLNDAWALSLADLRWRQLAKALLPPREYPSAVLLGRRMFMFGGAVGGGFFGDLHFLDLDTLEVRVVATSGAAPRPRTSPALFAGDRALYLWAGWDGRAHSGVYALDLDTGVWRGRTGSDAVASAPAFCLHRGKGYA